VLVGTRYGDLSASPTGTRRAHGRERAVVDIEVRRLAEGIHGAAGWTRDGLHSGIHGAVYPPGLAAPKRATPGPAGLDVR